MNTRERFGRIMRFQKPDRLPCWQVEGVAEAAVRRWVCDGDVPLGIRTADAVGFDGQTLIRLDTDPVPAFVERTIETDDDWRTGIDAYGFTVRTSRTQNVGPTHYHYLAGSVHGRDDWRAMVRRFDPADPRRRPRAWSGEYFDHLNAAADPVGLRIDWGPGRGVKNGYMMGLEPFCATLADDPALVEEMFAFWADFVLALAADWLANVRFDFAVINEDGIAFKNSTMISPATYRRLWAPHVRRVTYAFRAAGIGVVGYLTSGNVGPLIPELLDVGVNCLLPLEAAAGMDVRDLRREFGRDLLLIGNIARQAFMDGPAAVEAEFAAKVHALAADGGYLPAPDDLLMPDMPFPAVRRYVELVRAFEL